MSCSGMCALHHACGCRDIAARHPEGGVEPLVEQAPKVIPGRQLAEGVRRIKEIERRRINPPYAGLVMNDPDAGL